MHMECAVKLSLAGMATELAWSRLCSLCSITTLVWLSTACNYLKFESWDDWVVGRFSC